MEQQRREIRTNRQTEAASLSVELLNRANRVNTLSLLDIGSSCITDILLILRMERQTIDGQGGLSFFKDFNHFENQD